MTETEVIDQNSRIMDEAVEKAGELLMAKPHIAEIILKQLLKCDPEHLSGLQLLGLCKHRMGENAEAVEIIQTAIELNPEGADNYNNLGLAYSGLQQFDRAINSITRAVELRPDQYLFKNNLALQYRAIGDYENAVKYLREAIEVEEKPQLWLNLGSIYGEMRDLTQCEICYKKSVELDPEYSAGHVNMAFINHLKGDWKNGFKEYEWRFWYYPQMKFYLNAYDMSKLWDGRASLENKRVLVYGEQGMGDIIMFSRYLKNIKALGAHVILNAPQCLVEVLSRVEGIDEICTKDVHVEKGDPFPDYDYQFSLMSAPYLLQVNEICGKPYIKSVTDGFRDYIKTEYGESFKVGIVWAGNPAHPHDQKRSIHLKHFRGLYNTPGIKLFSLQMDLRKRQYGATYRNVEGEGAKVDDTCVDTFQSERGVVDYCDGCDDMRLVDLTKMIQSFEDTCTILAGLDLIICCDTATAHMAGAMGVPVWVLLPFNPDWRWLISGEATAWYDSMRLFRQSERDKWDDVFEKVEAELNAFVLQNQRQ